MIFVTRLHYLVLGAEVQLSVATCCAVRVCFTGCTPTVHETMLNIAALQIKIDNAKSLSVLLNFDWI